jgi:hypothetical protein
MNLPALNLSTKNQKQTCYLIEIDKYQFNSWSKFDPEDGNSIFPRSTSVLNPEIQNLNNQRRRRLNNCNCSKIWHVLFLLLLIFLLLLLEYMSLHKHTYCRSPIPFSNLRIYCYIHKNISLIPVLSQMAPVHNLVTLLSLRSILISFPLCLGLLRWLFLLGFPRRFFIHLWSLTFVLHTPPISFSWFVYPNNYWRKVHTINSTIMQFRQTFTSLQSFWLNFLYNPVLKHPPRLGSSFRARAHASQSYSFLILIFTILDSK